MGRQRAIAGHSWSDVLRSTVSNPNVGILGPFAVGDFVESVDIEVAATANAIMDVAVVWSLTPSVTDAAVVAGASIIERSPDQALVTGTGRVNTFEFLALQFQLTHLSIPVGVQVRSTGQHILVWLMEASDVIAWRALASAKLAPVVFAEVQIPS